MAAGFLVGIGFFLFWKHSISKVRTELNAQISQSKADSERSLRQAQANAAKQLEDERIVLEAGYVDQRLSLKSEQRRLKQAMEQFEAEKEELQMRVLKIEREEREIKEQMSGLERLKKVYRERIKHIARMNEDEAKALLKEEVYRESNREISALRKEMTERSASDIEGQARRLLIDCLGRITATPSTNLSASIIKLPNEEVKGRLIGKEGRNIKTFEKTSGTNLVVDETPGIVLVSSFDPVRREVARVALERLIDDGRIHPASIEEAVSNASGHIKRKIVDSGERALLELGINGVAQELVVCVGKLHFRLSNNQNTLEHSVEVAKLCALIAAELGLDPEIAKRCGLFHDMGKAIDCDYEKSHAIAAADLLKKHFEDPRVVNAVAASHGERPAESPYAEILKIADRLSATLPGARAPSLEGYIDRVRSLEALASSFEGVEDVYALQAGKEIRVIVSPSTYADEDAAMLTSNIRRKVETELNYFGKIKVTVIREQRFTALAQ